MKKYTQEGSITRVTRDDEWTAVSEYSQEGWVRDLPSLQQGRWDHGCSYFVSDDGTKVDIDIN